VSVLVASFASAFRTVSPSRLGPAPCAGLMGLIAAVEPNAAHGGVLHPNKWRLAGCARGDYEEESATAAEIRL